MKLLIGIPSPRAIPEFLDAIAKIPHDKYWIKNTPYADDPYGKIRAFFMEHSEYSHLAICPDDLIVNPEGVEQLWKDAKKFPVIMGMCNVSISHYFETPDKCKLALTKNLPDGDRKTRKYYFYTLEEVRAMKQDIIEVPWCGTPFAIFSREIVEKVEFKGDSRWNNAVAFAYDVGIAHDLKALGIPVRVDTRAYFFHNRLNSSKDLNVGKEEPYWIYDHGGKREIDPTLSERRFRAAYQAFLDSGGSESGSLDLLLRRIIERL